MKKIYCIIYSKYRKFKIPKISYIFKETLVVSNMTVNLERKIKKCLKKKNQLSY